ncbi:MAG: T9SS type A sorting domain-containing protein [Bacteriovoracaceae bacterium]|nr:T9SS type A sorting domain-containing protein [Bacteriovoracaceae bacterium]
MKLFLGNLFCLFTFFTHAQYSFSTFYTQNFDGLQNTPLNSTSAFSGGPTGELPHWLSTDANYTVSDGSNNVGDTYSFGTGVDRAFGSRASGSTGTIHYGIRFKNTTGGTINFLNVAYTGEQWRLAEKGTVSIDALTFSYQVSATPLTSLTTGSWTNVTPLDFTQRQNNATCGSSGVLIDGNNTLNRTMLNHTFAVSIAPDDEFILRWTDINNDCNDHALAIDDLTVTPVTTLPVTFISFEAYQTNNSAILLKWKTANETNNDYFNVYRQIRNQNNVILNNFEVIGRIDADNEFKPIHSYQIADSALPEENNIYHYRLSQVDLDGTENFYKTIEVKYNPEETKKDFRIYPNPSSESIFIAFLGAEFAENENLRLEIRDIHGRLLSQLAISYQRDFSNHIIDNFLKDASKKLSVGTYFLTFFHSQGSIGHKFIKK